MKPLKKTIAVIDLKAFYSFVECIDRGLDPFKTPLVVADKSRSKNTIVLSVTPFLKEKGIPSRLRIKDLPKKYDYIYATPRMALYIQKSSEVVSIMSEFVSFEDIHVYSIDEAFLDLTSYLAYYKMSAPQLVETIIKTIKEKTGLMATAGIGDNFFLSKIALDIYAKKSKNGIAIVNIEDVPNKLWNITPLSKVWGIGERTEAKLNALNIFTLGDLAHSSLTFLKTHFGIIGEQLYNHANGVDEADMHEVYIPKETSLSIGQALFKDYNKDNIYLIIKEMVDDLSSRLRSINKLSQVVSVYIGYAKVEQGGFSVQSSLLTATDDTKILYDAVELLVKQNIEDKPIRRVGVNFGKLCKGGVQQLNLFDNIEDQTERHKLNKAIDNIQAKYGKDKLLRASALTSDSTAITRHNQIGGHRK